ncbi:MAG: flagellar type III secretion system pore protein FliP [Pseudomonadota bacterium]
MAFRWAILGLILLAPLPAFGQSVTVDLAADGSFTLRAAQLFVLLTVLSLAPGLAIMITCFPFMVTVLSILRQALGVQQAPPNMMIISLALFLTYFVMEPVFRTAWDTGVRPLIDGALEPEAAFTATMAPFRVFMESRVDASALAMLLEARPVPLDEGAAPLSHLVPAFLLSEIKRGFEVGFLIFLPFLVIDLVIAAILMSMGMMMVPPVAVSLPFKLAFFVLADGWSLVAGALLQSYGP